MYSVHHNTEHRRQNLKQARPQIRKRLERAMPDSLDNEGALLLALMRSIGEAD